jgi:hypothetical protein
MEPQASATGVLEAAWRPLGDARGFVPGPAEAGFGESFPTDRNRNGNNADIPSISPFSFRSLPSEKLNE